MHFFRLSLCLAVIGITFLLVIIINHHTAYGELCAYGPFQKYNETDEVFLGQIISKEPFKFAYMNMKMTLLVSEVFKGKYNDTLTVFYNDCGEGMGCNDNGLVKGKQYVIFGQYSGNNLFSNLECGFILPADTYTIAEVNKLAHVAPLAPSPTPIYAPTETQFEKTVKVNDTNFMLNYTITGNNNTITSIKPDTHEMSLVILTSAQSYGNFTITLPRELIYAKINGNDTSFPYSYCTITQSHYDCGDILVRAFEKKATLIDRTITINFEKGSDTILLGGSHVIPEFGSFAGMIILISIIGVVLISRKFNYQVL